MTQALKTMALILAAAALCFVSAISGSALTKVFTSSGPAIPYVDFISIMLTAISLLITLLAFVLSIFAFIGWNSISSKVQSDVRAYLNDGFEDGHALHVMVRNELRAEKTKVMYEGVVEVDEEFEKDAEAEDADDRQ